jgi:hypothetical protein
VRQRINERIFEPYNHRKPEPRRLSWAAGE